MKIEAKRLLISLSALLVMVIAGGAVMAVRRVYTGPLHCQSCHDEQTRQWRASGTHSTETVCTDCHAPGVGVKPDRLNIFGYYRDAIAPTHVVASPATMSANCLACHESVLDSLRATDTVVMMDHRVHWQEEMICVDCHQNISHDLATGQTHRPAKKTCYQCHLRDIDVGSLQDRSCANCHRIILARDVQPVNSLASP